MADGPKIWTRLDCGHRVEGVHIGPQAWCETCKDFCRVTPVVIKNY